MKMNRFTGVPAADVKSVRLRLGLKLRELAYELECSQRGAAQFCARGLPAKVAYPTRRNWLRLQRKVQRLEKQLSAALEISEE